MERKLTAILAADVVGYSRMMGADEEGTLCALTACRRDIDERIARAGGRIFGTAGDSVIAEFPSSVTAVRCALEIQRRLAEQNAGLPTEKRMIFRIGINLGDVITEEGNLFGDGVNVAARLESIAPHGGICLSREIAEQTAGKVDATFAPAGPQTLKNIANPIEVFVWPAEAAAAMLAARNPARRNRAVLAVAALVAVLMLGFWVLSSQLNLRGPVAVVAAESPSIIVLPFVNFSEDSSQAYFSDGITDDLITDLSKVSGLFVIARATSFSHGADPTDIKAMAEQLGVRFVLQGSTRRNGDRIRINAQLTDTDTGVTVWADRFDGDFGDVFALQDRVTNSIVSSLAVELTDEEVRLVAKPLTGNSQAYDLYLQGVRAFNFFTPEANAEAQKLFQKAVDLDPAFAAAYAYQGQTYLMGVENNWTDDRSGWMEMARALSLRAVSLDPDLPFAHWALGRFYSRPFVGRYEESKEAFRTAVRLNPNYADAYMFLALTSIFSGNVADALPQIEKAMRLNPDYPFWYLQTLGMAQYFLGNYESSAKALESAIERNSNVPWLYYLLIATYGKLDMTEEAD
ncbi:MAG: adenylate/guanylate cyclase domain-containing protein, partial [Paracoccaceae bacterium]|nr:adenylate/guanylate cyclase domain-containing protein [Paracoccaceae bacterium]